MALNVYIKNNGCIKRRLDSSRLRAFFELNDHLIVHSPEKADLIVFVSCCLLKVKERESCSIISKLRGYRVPMIVTVCLPVMADERQRKFRGIKFIKLKDLEKKNSLLEDEKISLSSVPEANMSSLEASESSPFSFKGSSALLLIGRGCEGHCTYCVIKNGIGSYKSKAPDTCLAEYERFVRSGYRNCLLAADDTGAYGSDINTSLPELLNGMLSINDKFKVMNDRCKMRLEIQDLNPHWVIKYKDALISIVRKKGIARLACPIQSGSDRILRLMNRNHTRAEIEETLLGFRKAYRPLKLATTVIIGFPSETLSEFQSTLDCLSKIKFDAISLPAYSDSHMTASSLLENKLSQETIRKRQLIAYKVLSKTVKELYLY